ncbi:MAG TPA: helix-hairpin-helix domain-containing protein [Candidatus Solibacter sp.]|jgi:competence protein ComEA|nr:helix-hairpin-helix domain-containing protein [Candidatus Solibacter sp.]
MKHTAACAGVAAAALCMAAGEDAKLLPDGPGKEIVVRLCTECHGPENFRKVRHDKDEWSDSVGDMVDRGAKGTPAELEAVVDYLAQNFGTDSKVNVNTAPLQELKAQLDFSVPEALAVIAYRQNKGAFKEWRDLLKVNGVDPRKVEAKKEKMGF